MLVERIKVINLVQVEFVLQVKQPYFYRSYEMVPETVWKIQLPTAFLGISRGYNKKLKRMGIYTIEALAHAAGRNICGFFLTIFQSQ